MSHARGRFLREQYRINALLDWYILSALDLDEAVREKTKLALRLESGTGNLRPKELRLGAGAIRTMASKRFYGLMAEMALCRVVDNYLCYISELLAMLFRSHPECLKSSEQITLEFVLSHRTRSRLIRAIADRQVNRLSYQGMRDLNEYTSRKLGLPLLVDDSQLSQAIELIEMRNLIVHARGMVNEVFLSRTGGAGRELGSRLSFSFERVRKHADFMTKCVAGLEERAHEKFDFPLAIRAKASRERPDSNL
jgi:hypothetical protein